MPKITSRFYLLISILPITFILLAACTPLAIPKADPELTSSPTPTTAPAPTKTELVPVELTWILMGDTPPDAQAVMDKLNSLPQLKAINTKVKLVWYGWWEAYDQKTLLMFTAGEPCDLIYTANFTNNYVSGADKGNYVDLDELLPSYAPKTWKEVAPMAWTMSKVNGKIYGIPNQQIWYNAWGWQMRKDIANKYGVTLDRISKFEDLSPIMEKILHDNPKLKNQIIWGGGIYSSGTMGYDNVESGYGVIKQGDTTRKVVNLVEQSEFMDRVKLVRDWVKKGYTAQEVLDYGTIETARKAGFFPIILQVEKPGVAAEEKMFYGTEWIAEPLEKPVLGYVLPSMTGICASSKNPERALMFFDLMYSDAEVFNTVAKGIEDKHWVWIDKDKKVIGFPKGVDPSTSRYNVNVDWMFGNSFLGYYTNQEEVGAWDETRKVNSGAVLPMSGPFIFNSTPVQAELAALTTVDTQYSNPIYWGLVDPADPQKGIPAYIKAQKAAGVDKVLAEVQRQLDAFIAANPDIYN